MNQTGNDKVKSIALVLALLFAVLAAASQVLPLVRDGGRTDSTAQTEQILDVDQSDSETKVSSQSGNGESEASLPVLTFRNAKLLDQHYKKHGMDMGFSSAEEYEAAAAAVVADTKCLHKTEAEDGDDVYYLESTNDFVIVSTDGYIRTYFRPDRGIDYYNRQ